MFVFKCKMCGGELSFFEQMSVCECQYCGSKQTLPRLSTEKKKNLYDRAGYFRRKNEFDKAMFLYEQVLSEEPEDAESYWSLVLCRFGIEYVEDPMTYRRIPTVNRVQFTSILADEDYKSALRYADDRQRIIYEAEAKEIAHIQKQILAISNQEEAFDVFICYKESDEVGERTLDSVLANDLYSDLTREGLRVFFSRITLEDKLGSAYEPYIFAAINSAKVMVVLGTKPEYFNAVWVRNEWSRYLALIREGQKKTLIPVYKDMNPYDLPEEFASLQALDMGKLGYRQDLTHVIRKLLGKNEQNGANASMLGITQPLVKRAFMFLEDGEFNRADELCEQVLNLNPEEALAYIGKLMVEKKFRKMDALSEEAEEIVDNVFFKKALRFADDSLRMKLMYYVHIVEDKKKAQVYEEIGKRFDDISITNELKEKCDILQEVIEGYESLGGWQDSDKQIERCKMMQDELFEQIYDNAKEIVRECEKIKSISRKINVMLVAIEDFDYLGSYRDSIDMLRECTKNVEFYEMKINKSKVKRRRIRRLIEVPLVLIGAIWFAFWIIKEKKDENYNSCYECMKDCIELKEYDDALAVFEEVEGKEEAKKIVDELVYDKAKRLEEKREYEAAREAFEWLGRYKDSEEQTQKLTVIKAFVIEKRLGGIYELVSVDKNNLPRDLVIPDVIDRIGEGAFEGCTSLSSVVIPDGVVSIGEKAFKGCSGLNKVVVGKNVSSIENRAFENCYWLREIIIPESTTKMGKYVFLNCYRGLKIIASKGSYIWDYAETCGYDVSE